MKGKNRAPPIDTLAITQSLGLQTFRKQARRSWSKEDDTLLQKLLKELYPEHAESQKFDVNTVDWDAVAAALGGSRKAKDCRKRWIALLDPLLRRGRWTPEEDQILMESYNKYGLLWQKIARNIEGRTEHQCSKRYLEILDPALQNRLRPWTEEEDHVLVKMVLQHGTKWKTIASQLELRPPLTCRNRWRNLVTTIARGRANPNLVHAISQAVNGDVKSHLVGLSLPDLNDCEGRIKSEDDFYRPGSSSSGDTSVNRTNVYQPHSIYRLLGDYSEPMKYKEHDNNGKNYQIKQELAVDGISGGPSHEVPLISQGSSRNQHGSSHNSHNSHSHSSHSSHSSQSSHNSPALSIDSSVSHGTSTEASLKPVVLARSEEEWGYTLLRKEDAMGRFFESIAVSGTILSEHLVQQLVEKAAQRNVSINISHHVHHHYQKTRDSAGGDSTHHNGNPDAGFNLQNYRYKHGYDAVSPVTTPGLDARQKRRQHFNYLPPQMEVPQLGSSVVPALQSSSTHHHHHHYHHHHTKDGTKEKKEKEKNEKEKRELECQGSSNRHENSSLHENSGKVESLDHQENMEDNLKRLRRLERLNMSLKLNNDNSEHDPDTNMRNELGDLPQFDQLNQLDELERLEHPAKRIKVEDGEDGEGDELEFFETLRYLRRNSTDPITPKQGSLPPRESSVDTSVEQPVSQHHPLHYSTGTISSRGDDMFDIDAEDMIDSYGLFYHLYSTEPAPERSLSDDLTPFGVIPFNPS